MQGVAHGGALLFIPHKIAAQFYGDPDAAQHDSIFIMSFRAERSAVEESPSAKQASSIKGMFRQAQHDNLSFRAERSAVEESPSAKQASSIKGMFRQAQHDNLSFRAERSAVEESPSAKQASSTKGMFRLLTPKNHFVIFRGPHIAQHDTLYMLSF